MNSGKHAYGVIALWIAIVIFYCLAILGRVSSFLLDDIPLTGNECIKNLYRLRQANSLNLSRAAQACPNATWIRVEHPWEETRTLMVVRSGSDAGVTLLFDKDGDLVNIQDGVFHLKKIENEHVINAFIIFLILVPLLVLILVSRPSDSQMVRSGAILSFGTFLAYLSVVVVDSLNPLLSLIANGIIFSVALMAGIWTAVDIYLKRDAILRIWQPHIE
jgi:hypothetical protein